MIKININGTGSSLGVNQGGSTIDIPLDTSGIIELPLLYGHRNLASSFNFSGKSVVFLGDSITVGATLSNQTTQRFPTLLSTALSCTQVNKGVNSSTLEKRTPTDPLSGINMLDRLVDIPTKTGSNEMLCFCFGMNDWGCNRPDYNPTNFITDYNTVLDNARSKGWEPKNILIVSPPYPLDAAFAFYNGVNGPMGAPDRLGIVAFLDACKEIAESRATNYLDMYTAFENNTPASLVGADGVHPNSTGHIYMKDAIYNILTAVI